MLYHLSERWWVDPEYSHGYLVPVFALGLLWLRRQTLEGAVLKPSWWALPLLAAGLGLRLGGTYFYYTWLNQLSFLLVLAAICVGVGGRSALLWTWPAICFLVFMIPLPARLETLLAQPLQHTATLASTNALQTFGVFAESEGNVILLRDVEMGVVEACSGLRMLLVFIALSTAVAIVIHRSPRQKIIIALSAIPIALLCNIIRITLTGILHETVGHKLANAVFHDLAGLLMVPLALVFLVLELKLLAHLFVTPSLADSTAASLAELLKDKKNGSSASERRKMKQSGSKPSTAGSRSASRSR
jgi:exosortase